MNCNFLFPYAENVEELRRFCETAYLHTKTGGKFVAVSSYLNITCQHEDPDLEYKYEDANGLKKDQWTDGQLVR